MRRDTLVDTLMGRLGNYLGLELRDKIIAEMHFVIKSILEEDVTILPWFLLSESLTTETIPSEERLNLPVGFLQEYEDGALYRVNADGTKTELHRDDLDVITLRYPGEGLPVVYDIVGNYFVLRPIPNQIYTLKMRCYLSDDRELAGTYGDTANVENKWLQWASDLVLAETGFIIADQYLQSPKMAAGFEKAIIRARARLITKNASMQESNKQRYMEGS